MTATDSAVVIVDYVVVVVKKGFAHLRAAVVAAAAIAAAAVVAAAALAVVAVAAVAVVAAAAAESVHCLRCRCRYFHCVRFRIDS